MFEIELTKIKAVIFDLDGLLLDTEATFFKAWHHAAKAMAYQLPEQLLPSLSGMEQHALRKRLLDICGPDFDIDDFFQLSTKFWHEILQQEGIAVKTGFFSLMQTIERRRWKYTLATNSHSRLAQLCLDAAGLQHYFPSIIGSDSVKHAKPNPEIFYRAAAQLDQPISSCLILEDSAIGVRAAAQTGAHVVYIPSAYYPDIDMVKLADLSCKDMQQLAACL